MGRGRERGFRGLKNIDEKLSGIGGERAAVPFIEPELRLRGCAA